MKQILFLVLLLPGILANSQNPIRASKVSGTTIKSNPPAESKINQGTVQKIDPVFSNFSKMSIKLPFAKTAKEYMVEKVGHYYVLNGDIIVGNDFPKIMLYSSDDHDFRWEQAIIPYVVDPSIYKAGLNKIVFEAIAEFNGRTKLCLVRRTNQEDYVKIVFSTTIKGAGLSPVGRQGGEQHFYLAASATKGTVMHEMMHTAGFYHEQCRSDRDQFVRINMANVKDDLRNNFQIEEDGIARSAYDYCSIMHYSTTAFSKNKLPTIECVQNGVVVPCDPCVGNRERFTQMDISGIDWFYSNSSRFPCEPLPDANFVPFPHKFPNIYPSASAAAIAAFTHRAGVAAKEGFVGAYPNFHEARQGINTVGGTVFLKHGIAVWKDVPAMELGNPPLEDFAERMRATQVYATRNGFVGGFPTYHHAVYNNVQVHGTVLIPAAGADWRDVPLSELGNPALDDIGARMRSANDYAFRNGYVGGFPTFFHADYGRGIVCGIVLIKKSAGEWRDVVVIQGPK